MTDKADYKKADKELYLPGRKPVLVTVPEMNFIMVDGSGAPSQSGYQEAVKILYALSYTIKMSHKSSQVPAGYYEYKMMPLEGLWWLNDGSSDFTVSKSKFMWTSMIRQPEFVTQEVFDWAVLQCRKKKPDIDVSKARLEKFTEGLCVQVMHTGSYDAEPATIKMMDEFIEENQLINRIDTENHHHEIYLNNPQRTAEERLKTVIRIPVAKQ